MGFSLPPRGGRDCPTRPNHPYLCGKEVLGAMGEAAMRGLRLPAYPPVKGPRTEAGAALLAFLLVLLVGGSYALLGDAKSLAQRAKLEESRKTSEALAEAKAALIGYAVSAKLTPPGSCATNASRCPRPGDLPCPDRNNDGYAENSPATGTPPSPCGMLLDQTN